MLLVSRCRVVFRLAVTPDTRMIRHASDSSQESARAVGFVGLKCGRFGGRGQYVAHHCVVCANLHPRGFVPGRPSTVQ